MKQRIHEYLTRQYMLSSNYEIFHYQNKDLAEISLHHHDFYECYYLVSGNVTYLIEGKTYFLKPGDFILINCTELHQAIIEQSDAPYERIVLWISRAFLDELSTAESDLSLCFEAPEKKNVLRVDFEMQKTLERILYKLLNLDQYKGMGYELLYRAYIVEFLVQINDLVFQGNFMTGIDVMKSNLIDGIIEYVNEHIHEDISLDTLSECFYLSKFHLSREFKKHTGATIHRYIVQKKLIEAKELILKGSPITAVYKQCGFGDYSNFFRAFKNEYGVTPKQFLSAMRTS